MEINKCEQMVFCPRNYKHTSALTQTQYTLTDSVSKVAHIRLDPEVVGRQAYTLKMLWIHPAAL